MTKSLLRRFAFRALAPLALVAASASAVPAADAAAGGDLARRWCAGCHLVAATQAQAQSDAPSFAAIAARGGDLSAAWLAFRLLNPHPAMPQVSLTRAEAQDLAAYFASLKP